MRILLLTQALDKNDPVLSAYHRLIVEIARNFSFVTVVCLKKGEYDLPKNVKVFSLGKEEGRSRIKYIFLFFYFSIKNIFKYDVVFVHMNQEYVLLGGIFWKLFGKNIYMWRNHHAGSFLTDVSAMFCKKVFCTSKFSFTAKYKKTVIMPVGIDTNFFRGDASVTKVPHSILFLARIAPVKKPHILIEALKILNQKYVSFVVNIYGDPLPGDIGYYENLKKVVGESGLSQKIFFHKGISNTQTVEVFNSHEVFVNLSSSGMYDKTIFEAMACESLSLASNKNLEGLIDPMFIFEEDNAGNLSQKLEYLLETSLQEKKRQGSELRKVVIDHHSLTMLGQKLAQEIH